MFKYYPKNIIKNSNYLPNMYYTYIYKTVQTYPGSGFKIFLSSLFITMNIAIIASLVEEKKEATEP